MIHFFDTCIVISRSLFSQFVVFDFILLFNFYLILTVFCYFVFFFKQKTAYEMRISDWSSDVCSSDLMLVFKDTILSLVASVQLSSNDMLRVGDWIEMPSQNADGDVVDISLHTVKVQNWDKTISTIPTWALISESYRNWRGMTDFGGRRIKRALLIDQTSVRFLEPEERQRLRRFALIDGYLDRQKAELADYNAKLEAAGKDPVNNRRATNLGTFRAYMTAYLQAHPGVAHDMTLMVRQLDPTPTGLPQMVYYFSADVSWVPYENLAGDIFDHLLAVMPEFGLRVFQQPSGAELSTALANLRIAPAAPDAAED